MDEGNEIEEALIGESEADDDEASDMMEEVLGELSEVVVRGLPSDTARFLNNLSIEVESVETKGGGGVLGKKEVVFFFQNECVCAPVSPSSNEVENKLSEMAVSFLGPELNLKHTVDAV